MDTLGKRLQGRCPPVGPQASLRATPRPRLLHHILGRQQSGLKKGRQKVIPPPLHLLNPTQRIPWSLIHRVLEGVGNKKPDLTEEQKVLIRKREQLRRVRECLKDPNLRPGIARDLRKHIVILEREIAELE